MKRILASALLLCCVLSLAACSSQPKNIFFTAQDLNGKTVYGDEVFKANKVTLINVWATWCGPCVSELPELQKIYNEYKDTGVEIIGLCVDQNPQANMSTIKNTLSKAGVKYKIIFNTQELNDLFPAKYIPTTYFIDSNGNAVGEPIVGADPASYRARIELMLSKNN